MKKNNKLKKDVISHLKGDMKMFEKEEHEDEQLVRKLSKKNKSPKKKTSSRGKKKIEKVMEEFKSGKLHSGSKKGPKVTSRKQAVAIALSEARRAKKKKNR